MPASRAALLRWTDLAATAVFAWEGAAAGALAGLDVFGVLVVGFVTAVGGGIVRDLILGEHPPAALRSYHYPVAIAVAVGALVAVHGGVERAPGLLIWCDAAGLALFAVTGAAKAVDRGLNPVAAVLLGIMTGVGGGVLRDVLLNRVPAVLDQHVYAVAAGLGALVTVVGLRVRWSRAVAFAAGAAACLALRMVSYELDWNLPRLFG